MSEMPMNHNDPLLSDPEMDDLVAELALDGIVVTREEARKAVLRLAELLDLISRPLPLPSPISDSISDT